MLLPVLFSGLGFFVDDIFGTIYQFVTSGSGLREQRLLWSAYRLLLHDVGGVLRRIHRAVRLCDECDHSNGTIECKKLVERS